jgi:hypothetical protein
MSFQIRTLYFSFIWKSFVKFIYKFYGVRLETRVLLNFIKNLRSFPGNQFTNIWDEIRWDFYKSL